MWSKSSSSKKPVQQEMVQVERSDSASAFWRTRSNDKTRSSSDKKRDSNLVIGASYSHADMLKMDSHSSTSSRPRTPPPNKLEKKHSKSASKSSLGVTSPAQNGYTSFLSSTNDDWVAPADEDDDDEEYGYEVSDGDEFGLPSVTTSRRKQKSKQSTLGQNSEPTPLSPWDTKPPTDYLSTRRLSDSADIAIERPPVSYPVPKKSEGKILRPQYKEILRDPANSLHLIHHPPIPDGASQKEVESYSHRINRINKFKKILQATTIPIQELRSASWNGVPDELRPMTWMLLLGYLPTSSERRVSTLERKRKEYLDGVQQAFQRGGVGSSNTAGASSSNTLGKPPGGGRGLDEQVWHQISIDVPRTNPHLELYQYEATQRSLERILYLWAVRHPASGYVQGINDLVTPFWEVFLSAYITEGDIEFGMDPGQLPQAVLDAVEADSFWCLTKLLDGIQDNYIFAQPGIQRQVNALRDLTSRIDKTLADHLEREGIEFIQFSFRWMNCLLMREVSVRNTVRMWDTYMAEDQGFSTFHLYVCAAFLVKWSSQLLKMDFQEIMMFLQALPSRGGRSGGGEGRGKGDGDEKGVGTKDWTEKDVELLLSEAYIWMQLFQGSQAHLREERERPRGVVGI